MLRFASGFAKFLSKKISSEINNLHDIKKDNITDGEVVSPTVMIPAYA